MHFLLATGHDFFLYRKGDISGSKKDTPYFSHFGYTDFLQMVLCYIGVGRIQNNRFNLIINIMQLCAKLPMNLEHQLTATRLSLLSIYHTSYLKI